MNTTKRPKTKTQILMEGALRFEREKGKRVDATCRKITTAIRDLAPTEALSALYRVARVLEEDEQQQRLKSIDDATREATDKPYLLPTID